MFSSIDFKSWFEIEVVSISAFSVGISLFDFLGSIV